MRKGVAPIQRFHRKTNFRQIKLILDLKNWFFLTTLNQKVLQDIKRSFEHIHLDTKSIYFHLLHYETPQLSQHYYILIMKFHCFHYFILNYLWPKYCYIKFQGRLPYFFQTFVMHDFDICHLNVRRIRYSLVRLQKLIKSY